MSELKDLEEYNIERAKLYHVDYSPKRNGIACPNCGKELYDTEPYSLLMSNPPRYSIICQSCNFKGSRIA